jgi:cysteine desulfurase
MRKIYLDHNATTPVHPGVKEAMLPYLEDSFGNPSSVHWAGREPREALEGARTRVASLINSDASEIVFTSGGSEGDNMAIKGALIGNKAGSHVITTAVEHPAVYRTCMMLKDFGFDFTFLPVNGFGMPDPEEARKAIRKETVLISVMFANNETGNLLPVNEIADIARENGVLMHTDAVQAAGKLPIDVSELKVDILTASGHKFNAPKGIGFQYLRKGTNIQPLISGGSQENGWRSGTENIAGIVALGKACEIARRDMEARIESIGQLRDILENTILERVAETSLNGHPEKRIYNTSSISFRYIEGEALSSLLEMEGIAVSTGSACSSQTSEPSHVLTSMGLDPICSRGTIRFSLGMGNTEEDVQHCLEVIPSFAERLQKMSPLA